MKLNNSKKGILTPKFISSAFLLLIVVVILFQVYADVIPEAQAAGNSLNESIQCTSNRCFFNATGNTTTGIRCFAVEGEENVGCATSSTHSAIPFAGLFSGTGIVFLIIMAALLILVVKAYFSNKKNK